MWQRENSGVGVSPWPVPQENFFEYFQTGKIFLSSNQLKLGSTQTEYAAMNQLQMAATMYIHVHVHTVASICISLEYLSCVSFVTPSPPAGMIRLGNQPKRGTDSAKVVFTLLT